MAWCSKFYFEAGYFLPKKESLPTENCFLALKFLRRQKKIDKNLPVLLSKPHIKYKLIDFIKIENRTLTVIRTNIFFIYPDKSHPWNKIYYKNF